MTRLLNFILLATLYACTTRHIPASVSPARPISRNENILKLLSVPVQKAESGTAALTLENGGESFFARLWLLQHARKSIDIQYYSFAKDLTGLIVSDHIIQAADAGVKVRVLIDDAAARMYSYEVRLLDAHENIEIKVYNAGLMLGRADRRIYQLLGNYNRLLRRMHNKSMVIDDVLSISGGRNIADEYFDYDEKYNFRDRDVLLIGKAVGNVKESFEKFWTNKLSVPYSELDGKHRRKIDSRKRYNELHKDAEQKTGPGIVAETEKFPEKFNAAELMWVPSAEYISDEPGKNEHREGRKGGICRDSLLNLFRNAKHTIDIQSPYFITTDEDLDLLRETLKRGIKIRLLTNSLASIDNIEAFSAYRKDRAKLIEAGIEIYEFKPDAEIRFKRMIPAVQIGLDYKPVYGFHSKTIVIDNFVTVIGSYNFDPRSANYNTECITIIRSQAFAATISGYINEEFLPGNAWQDSKSFNPDGKASFKKRIKAVSNSIVPKKLL